MSRSGSFTEQKVLRKFSVKGTRVRKRRNRMSDEFINGWMDGWMDVGGWVDGYGWLGGYGGGWVDGYGG